MDGLKKKLARVLARRFPQAKLTVDAVTPVEMLGAPRPGRDDYAMTKVTPAKLVDKFSGLVVWDGFDGLDQVERQAEVWKVLRSDLSRDEQLRVTAILTLTPAER